MNFLLLLLFSFLALDFGPTLSKVKCVVLDCVYINFDPYIFLLLFVLFLILF